MKFLKRLSALALGLLLAFALSAFGADSKITALPSLTTPHPTDEVPIVDMSGTPTTKQITYQNFFTAPTIAGSTLTGTTTNSGTISGGNISGATLDSTSISNSVTTLTGKTAPGSTDLVPIVDMSGTPTGKSITIPNLVGPPSSQANLPHWFNGNLSGKKVVWLGDSTTDQLFSIGYLTDSQSSGTGYFFNHFQFPGGPLYGVTHYDFGFNGSRLLGASGWNNDGFGSMAANAGGRTNGNLSAIVTINPDLIIFSFGINDVRIVNQNVDLPTLTAGLTAAVNRIRAALPNTDIVLRMPNVLMANTASGTYLSTDGSTPMTLAQVQTASDTLRLAYRAMVGKWPNVAVWDCQGRGPDSIFPEQVPSVQAVNGHLTNYALLANELHPSSSGAIGYELILDRLAWLIGQDHPLDIGAIIDAWTKSVSNPHIYYPRVIEAGLSQFVKSKALALPKLHSTTMGQWINSAGPVFYDLIYFGQSATQGAGFLDSDTATWTPIQGVITPGTDIFVQYGAVGTNSSINDYLNTATKENVVDGVVAFTIPGGASVNSAGRIFGLGTGYPGTEPNPGNGIHLIVRKRPAAQKTAWCEAPNFQMGGLTLPASTTNVFVGQVSMAALYTSATIKAVTAPTTGGTITLRQNGTVFATVVWANGASTATITWANGADGLAGGWVFNEGDFITADFGAGFVGGANWSIVLEKPNYPCVYTQ